MCARKSLQCHEGTVSRNMGVKGDSGEGSERRERAGEKTPIFLVNT